MQSANNLNTQENILAAQEEERIARIVDKVLSARFSNQPGPFPNAGLFSYPLNPGQPRWSDVVNKTPTFPAGLNPQYQPPKMDLVVVTVKQEEEDIVVGRFIVPKTNDIHGKVWLEGQILSRCKYHYLSTAPSSVGINDPKFNLTRIEDIVMDYATNPYNRSM